MSSRVLPPGGSAAVAPFTLRSVHPGGDIEHVAGEMRRDFEARLDELERQDQQKIREAHAAGVREGEAATHQRAQAEVAPVLERLARSIDEISGMRGRLRREAEADLVKLALAIAARVLRREVSVDPDALQGLVRAALEKLDRQEVSRVRIHPALAPSMVRALAGSPHIEITADPSRETGGIIFETPRGNLDASIESQLREIERGLADCLRKSS
jgi:flagellar assembly protein FliH